MWYVTSAPFSMDRVAEMNPFIRGNFGDSLPVLDSVDYQLCHDSLGYQGTPPISVTFTRYNERCRGFSLEKFITGLWKHEGMGSKDSLDPALANGHQARLKLAATDVANDPRALVEPLVSPYSSIHLRQVIEEVVVDADLRLDAFSNDLSGFVKDNYVLPAPAVGCGQAWVLTNLGPSTPPKYFLYPMAYKPTPTSPSYCF